SDCFGTAIRTRRRSRAAAPWGTVWSSCREARRKSIMRTLFQTFYGDESAADGRQAASAWPQAKSGGYVRWNWLPWKFLLRRAARAHGFLDPVALLGRLQRFAQPSEVHEPVELLRAGVVFHARGLINARVIQHNLDWIWPYWV